MANDADLAPFYIATVWVGDDMARVFRLRALNEQEYRDRVRAAVNALDRRADDIEFGPVSLARVQV